MKRDKVSWGIQGQRQTWTRLHKTSQRVCRSGFLYLRKVKEPEYELTLEDIEYLRSAGIIFDEDE